MYRIAKVLIQPIYRDTIEPYPSLAQLGEHLLQS